MILRAYCKWIDKSFIIKLFRSNDELVIKGNFKKGKFKLNRKKKLTFVMVTDFVFCPLFFYQKIFSLLSTSSVTIFIVFSAFYWLKFELPVTMVFHQLFFNFFFPFSLTQSVIIVRQFANFFFRFDLFSHLFKHKTSSHSRSSEANYSLFDVFIPDNSNNFLLKFDFWIFHTSQIWREICSTHF